MLNLLIFQGRLVKDCEQRKSAKGVDICSFTLAQNNPVGDKATFLDCCVTGDTATRLSKFLTKGKQIIAQGRLDISTFTDKNGLKRLSVTMFCTNLDFLGDGSKKPDDGSKKKKEGYDIDAPIDQNEADGLPF